MSNRVRIAFLLSLVTFELTGCFNPNPYMPLAALAFLPLFSRGSYTVLYIACRHLVL